MKLGSRMAEGESESGKGGWRQGGRSSGTTGGTVHCKLKNRFNGRWNQRLAGGRVVERCAGWGARGEATSDLDASRWPRKLV